MAKKKDKITFISLGCPKNRVDTEIMAGIACENDLEITGDPENADVIVVNTCGFIESAKEESIETIFEMAKYKNTGRCKKLIVAGCLSQRYAEQLSREIKEIDTVLGTNSALTLKKALQSNNRVMVKKPGHFLPFYNTPRFIEPGSQSAYVKICDGCSRKCSFCAIPAIRGKAKSRPIEDIVKEIKKLSDAGIVEINLVGQDISSYGRDLKDKTSLSKLLKILDSKNLVPWVRLLYLYPDNVDETLLETIAGSKTILPYLDIPIQHASTKILKKMKRGHGKKTLTDLIKQTRKIIPGVTLRTTVLVGFPGETDDDFNELMEFLKWAGFDHFGAFRYSPEEGTASYNMKNEVKKNVSYQRWRKVMALGRKISRQKTRELKGRNIDVLLLKSAYNAGYVLSGRHAGQAPEIDGVTYVTSCPPEKNEIIKAKVIKTGDFDIVAKYKNFR